MWRSCNLLNVNSHFVFATNQTDTDDYFVVGHDVIPHSVNIYPATHRAIPEDGNYPIKYQANPNVQACASENV
jgi:hypothetical protein